MAELPKLSDLIEQGVVDHDDPYPDVIERHHLLRSIAISLKRIADATAGDRQGKSSGIVHALHDIGTGVARL